MTKHLTVFRSLYRRGRDPSRSTGLRGCLGAVGVLERRLGFKRSLGSRLGDLKAPQGMENPVL